MEPCNLVKKIEKSSRSKETDKIKKPRGRIKKTRWKTVPLLETIKNQPDMFFIYGSQVILTDYSSDQAWNQNYYSLISQYQHITSVTHNKILGTVETQYSVHNPGLVDFSFVARILERKQDRDYYEIAKALRNFSKFVGEASKQIVQKAKQLKNTPEILDKLDEQYTTFENWAENFANTVLKEEFYGYSLFRINYRKGFAEMKKQVASKNWIELYGTTADDCVETEILKMHHKCIFFEKKEEYLSSDLLHLVATQLQSSAQQRKYSSIPFTLKTNDGFCIPAVLEQRLIQFSDFQTDNQCFEFIDSKDYQMIVQVFKVENIWLKRLIDMRNELSQIITDALKEKQFGKVGMIEQMCQEVKLEKKEQNSKEEINNQDIDSEQDNGSLQLGSSVIDLVANEQEEAEKYCQTKMEQAIEKQKIIDNVQIFSNRRQIVKQLSSLEYACKVEFFVDKFYIKNHGQYCHYADL